MWGLDGKRSISFYLPSFWIAAHQIKQLRNRHQQHAAGYTGDFKLAVTKHPTPKGNLATVPRRALQT
eukprot:1159856-Pelagomonas_calceolata.AAC.6